MNPARPTPILAILAALALAACGQSETATSIAPLEISQGTACSLDGMLLADYPGPKAQIHYAGQAEPDFFCDTVEMFHMVLTPEQARAVRGLFVQDMGRAAWDEPRGHWIDARTAYYVIGSTRRGSMGPTIASFAQEADATKFASEYGGTVHRFADITPDMVVLDGGALHDSNM
jgi:copper chaperone NosL